MWRARGTGACACATAAVADVLMWLAVESGTGAAERDRRLYLRRCDGVAGTLAGTCYYHTDTGKPRTTRLRSGVPVLFPAAR